MWPPGPPGPPGQPPTSLQFIQLLYLVTFVGLLIMKPLEDQSIASNHRLGVTSGITYRSNDRPHTAA